MNLSNLLQATPLPHPHSHLLFWLLINRCLPFGNLIHRHLELLLLTHRLSPLFMSRRLPPVAPLFVSSDRGPRGPMTLDKDIAVTLAWGCANRLIDSEVLSSKAATTTILNKGRSWTPFVTVFMYNVMHVLLFTYSNVHLSGLNLFN